MRNIREYIRDVLKQPMPPHSSVSTIVRLLDNQEDHKGFVGFKAYGRTYEYYPLISKEAYSHFKLKNLMSDYFEGSPNQLVSFLMKEEKISTKELEQIRTIIMKYEV